jgi:hypothetical protein
MKTFFGLLLLGATLVVGAPAAKAQVAVGITIGAPPPPRVVAVRPVSPGPEFFWVDGYWYPVSGHYRWHKGYWTRPPYAGARWVVPRHEGGMYYSGYWDGDRGRFEHDHHWDHDHNRDHDRYREHDHEHDHDH